MPGQPSSASQGRRVLMLPQTDFSSPAMADELCDLLREFDEVMEDFDRGPTRQYEQHLEELKRKAGTRVYDSGIDELESESGLGNEESWWGWRPSGWSSFRSSGANLHGKLLSFLLVLPLSCSPGPSWAWVADPGAANICCIGCCRMAQGLR